MWHSRKVPLFDMRSAWLIYNPAAGRFPAGWLLSRAVGVLDKAGWAVEVREAQHGGHLSDLAREAVEAGCQAVFVAGGDGSVGRVASALSGTDVALGCCRRERPTCGRKKLASNGWTGPTCLLWKRLPIAWRVAKSIRSTWGERTAKISCCGQE